MLLKVGQREKQMLRLYPARGQTLYKSSFLGLIIWKKCVVLKFNEFQFLKLIKLIYKTTYLPILCFN